MIRYLVKVVSTAKSNNHTYAEGTKHVYYYGANCTLIYSINSWVTEQPNLFLAREYGYKSEASAKRSYVYKHNDDDVPYERRWNSAVSIVPFEC